jgi:DNA primase
MTHEVKLSSADRVLFPDDGVTKGDLFALAVSPVRIKAEMAGRVRGGLRTG